MTTTTYCKNQDCLENLDYSRSDEDERYCGDCGDQVQAFCPQPHYNMVSLAPEYRAMNGEDWFMVGRSTDASDQVKKDVSGGQCDSCGGDWFTFEPRPTGCVVTCNRCNHQFPVAALPGRLVIW